MSEQEATEALISDLQRQIDQLIPRGIKNNHGNPYNPAHYKRGLANAIDLGGSGVADFVRAYLYKSPSDGYKKLEAANALDLACESLVVDETKPYAQLFSAEDREAARTRLGTHIDAIDQRQADERARLAAATERLRAKGLPRRWELDSGLRSRRTP